MTQIVADVTINKFIGPNSGTGVIKTHLIVKKAPGKAGGESKFPDEMLGLASCLFRPPTGRYILLLYGNHKPYTWHGFQYPVRKGKNDQLEVRIDSLNANSPWKPLEQMMGMRRIEINKVTKMKNILIGLFTLTLAISAHGFERDYVPRAVLTKEQEKTVLELAKKAGIKKVAKISSHNMFPSPFRGLRVQGVEQVKGREVSYQVLSMSHSEWLQPGAKPRKGQVQMGNFWAGKPYTRKQTILKVGKKEYRTGSIQGMTAEECETILRLFLDGEYAHGPAVNAKLLSQVDWTKPSRFSKRGESISVGFLHKAKDGGFFDLQIKLVGNALTITQMFQAVP